MSDAASPLSVSMLVGLNVIGSVLLVAVNKLLVVSYGFRHMVLLSGLHFAVGWAVLQAASAPALPAGSRLFERKAPGWLAALPAAVAGALSIVLMNYSLRTNSLGSYQMLKVAVLPATIALAAGQGTAVTGADVGAAALVSLGTAVATVTDVDLSLAGTAVGLAAVAATAQYQVAQGRVQTELVLSSAQALHALSAPQAVLTLVAAVVFETAWQARLGGGGTSLRGGSVPALGSVAPDDIWSHAYSANEVGLIVLTCICAAILNYSGIAIIGKINPVAFQFVNQLKVRCAAAMHWARLAMTYSSAHKLMRKELPWPCVCRLPHPSPTLPCPAPRRLCPPSP